MSSLVLEEFLPRLYTDEPGLAEFMPNARGDRARRGPQ
jgi:hypothetical protein